MANGADCLVLDVEGQYEGRYPQASYFMSSLRSRIGQDYPVGLASFPYVDYHPALPYSVFLGPGGAQYNVPQLYWKDIGTTVDTGFIHTWVWNRIYQRPIAPARAGLQQPEGGADQALQGAGDVARLRGRQLVVLAVGRQAAVEGGRRSGRRPRPAPYPSYPFLRLGSKGDFVAWAQQLLAGAGYPVPITGYYQGSDPGGRLLLPGRPRPAADREPRRADLAALRQSNAAAGPLDQERRSGVRLGWTRGAAAAPLGEAARGPGRDPASRQARAIAARSSRGRN